MLLLPTTHNWADLWKFGLTQSWSPSAGRRPTHMLWGSVFDAGFLCILRIIGIQFGVCLPSLFLLMKVNQSMFSYSLVEEENFFIHPPGGEMTVEWTCNERSLPQPVSVPPLPSLPPDTPPPSPQGLCLPPLPETYRHASPTPRDLHLIPPKPHPKHKGPLFPLFWQTKGGNRDATKDRKRGKWREQEKGESLEDHFVFIRTSGVGWGFILQ